MYDPDIHSVRSGNYHTLTIATPVAVIKDPFDYENITNKPTLNGVEISGDMTLEDFGLGDVPTAILTAEDIDEIIDGPKPEEDPENPDDPGESNSDVPGDQGNEGDPDNPSPGDSNPDDPPNNAWWKGVQP